MHDVGLVKVKLADWRVCGQQVINGRHQVTWTTNRLDHRLLIRLKSSSVVATLKVWFQVKRRYYCFTDKPQLLLQIP
jgi:hypothetical protein